MKFDSLMLNYLINWNAKAVIIASLILSEKKSFDITYCNKKFIKKRLKIIILSREENIKFFSCPSKFWFIFGLKIVLIFIDLEILQ